MIKDNLLKCEAMLLTELKSAATFWETLAPEITRRTKVLLDTSLQNKGQSMKYMLGTISLKNRI